MNYRYSIGLPKRRNSSEDGTKKYNKKQRKIIHEFKKACFDNDLKTISSLICKLNEEKISIRVENDYVPYMCCRFDQKEMLELLLVRGLDISDGWLLAECCRKEKIDLVKLLLDYGADINANDSEPLFIAINTSTRLTMLLIERGANIDNWGQIMLSKFAGKNHFGTVNLLINKGIEVTLDAIRAAKINNHHAMVSFLLTRCSNFDNFGQMLLFEFVNENNFDIVKILINKDGIKVTPDLINVAKLRNFDKIATLLIDKFRRKFIGVHR